MVQATHAQNSIDLAGRYPNVSTSPVYVSSTYGPPKKSLRALNRRSAQCFALGGDGGLFRECALQIGPRMYGIWCRPFWFTRTIVASTARSYRRILVRPEG